MNIHLLRLFSIMLTFALFASCIRNTDFNEPIVLTPVIELNLIYFNLDAGAFYDDSTATPRLTVRDTTAISFLDEDFVQESLKRAEFYYRFTNSIPRDFLVDFQFLSEENDTTYTTQAIVNPGTPNNPVVSELIDNIEGGQILQLTNANKVVYTVTIPSSDENLEGTLNLQSKTTYYLEF